MRKVWAGESLAAHLRDGRPYFAARPLGAQALALGGVLHDRPRGEVVEV